MRHDNTTELEFKSKLKQILTSHPSQSIHFRQFVSLLAQHEISLYSRAQLLKIGKFFNNPLKLSCIQVPLSYLHLHSVSIKANSGKSFIVKVNSQPASSILGLIRQEKGQHEIGDCVDALLKRLNKLYGSQSNWFQQLAGSTVSVSVDMNIFKHNLQKVLMNTRHESCLIHMMPIFQKECYSKEVQFSHFTTVVNKLLRKNCSPSSSMHRTNSRNRMQSANDRSNRKANSTALTNLSMTEQSQTQRRYYATMSFNQDFKWRDSHSSRKYAQSEITNKSIKKQGNNRYKTTNDSQNQKSNVMFKRRELTNNFCISAKRCSMFDKNIGLDQNSQTSRPLTAGPFQKRSKTSRKQHTFRTHKLQQNLKVQGSMIHSLSGHHKNSFSLNISSLQKDMNLQRVKTEQSKHGIDAVKVDEYVVVFENEHGEHIQI